MPSRPRPGLQSMWFLFACHLLPATVSANIPMESNEFSRRIQNSVRDQISFRNLHRTGERFKPSYLELETVRALEASRRAACIAALSSAMADMELPLECSKTAHARVSVSLSTRRSAFSWTSPFFSFSAVHTVDEFPAAGFHRSKIRMH